MQLKPQMDTDGHRLCGLKGKTYESPSSHSSVIGPLDREETSLSFPICVYLRSMPNVSNGADGLRGKKGEQHSQLSCPSENPKLNPKWIPPQSPGLRGTSYPGKRAQRRSTPKGLRPRGRNATQPRWG